MADVYKKISEYNELAELDASGKMLVAQSDETYSVGADTMADFVKGRITMDTTPTQGSSNPVTSNGVYNGIRNYKISDRSTDQGMIFNDWIMLQHNGGDEYKVRARDALGMAGFGDSVPTPNSARVVWSGGVYDAIQEVRALMETDDTLSVEDKPADAKAVGDAISSVRNIAIGDADALSYDLVTGKYIRLANGAAVNSSSYDVTDYISVSDYKLVAYTRMRMRAESSQAAAIAFYDSSQAYLIGYEPVVGADSIGSDLVIVQVPTGAASARITYLNSTFDVPPMEIYGLLGNESTAARISLLEQASYAAMGLHTIPKSQGVLNCIKRARQMTDIEWIPAVDLPRACSLNGPYSRSTNAVLFENVFKAGTKYKGLPYSRSDIHAEDLGYDTMTVGIDSPFSAFATCVTNADSVISQESEYSTGDGSPRSVYFGTICSGLVCYALGLQSLTLTANIPSISGMSKISNLITNGVRFNLARLRLGDLILKSGFHVGIVTDIVAENGEVTGVEVSEATTSGIADKTGMDGGLVGGVCRRIVWPVDDFFSWWRDYAVYRYSYIDAVSYTPVPYVRVGTEGEMLHYDKLPVMPYMGEGFKFKVGHIRSDALLIAKPSDFTNLRIYKDGTLLSDILISGRSSVPGGFTAAGIYEAYLCNLSGSSETSRSVSCHWSVIA